MHTTVRHAIFHDHRSQRAGVRLTDASYTTCTQLACIPVCTQLARQVRQQVPKESTYSSHMRVPSSHGYSVPKESTPVHSPSRVGQLAFMEVPRYTHEQLGFFLVTHEQLVSCCVSMMDHVSRTC